MSPRFLCGSHLRNFWHSYGEFIWDWGEFLYGSPQAGEVLVHVAGKAVGNIAREVGVFVGKVAEAEVRVVEGVNQFAHVL
ncbi:uncharacterized protein METZ01_LOCUS180992, partial [marine metagenome]